MSCSSSSRQDQEAGASEAHHQRKYKGVRLRKWGKWVSEIRVPGKQDRLWLGSYSSPEAAAVAHDIASYCLRGPSSLNTLNFPLMLPPGVTDNMSPKSVQRAASDAGMAVDARMILSKSIAAHDEMKMKGSDGDVQGMDTGSWEDDGSAGSGTSYGNWEGNGGTREEEGLDISIEDYL
ncbi:hypothetical protein Tsubulata_042571 [Turnera subulata]|uniref:AP2/ERF domain-containing protein n=1 Tax=Turnera subulata TaxID=218843 RepID=A0A9Q0GC02_9ROSI|nr:hypothetical protein Tsubulata_042571 [Turnera subulata]